ncbi:2204_t:CDS:2 [Scutellospora calospora]|uniref:2204_t:CDS:1 n=1 Tax=Scutellospora calospora TaxID=85575 RepID=A0ACA9K483_9GLOM|nr:2204_t:CDS:2 [Scutellospora calospora]
MVGNILDNYRILRNTTISGLKKEYLKYFGKNNWVYYEAIKQVMQDRSSYEKRKKKKQKVQKEIQNDNIENQNNSDIENPNNSDIENQNNLDIENQNNLNIEKITSEFENVNVIKTNAENITSKQRPKRKRNQPISY